MLRDGDQPTSEIANAAGVNADTARAWLDDLRLLEIVERSTPATNLHTWRLRAGFIETMNLAGLGGVVSTPPPDSYPHVGGAAEHGGKSHPHPHIHDDPNPDPCADALGDDADERWIEPELQQ